MKIGTRRTGVATGTQARPGGLQRVTPRTARTNRTARTGGDGTWVTGTKPEYHILDKRDPKCVHCNEVNYDGSNFCCGCGKVEWCFNCNYQRPRDTEFCHNCGEAKRTTRPSSMDGKHLVCRICGYCNMDNPNYCSKCCHIQWCGTCNHQTKRLMPHCHHCGVEKPRPLPDH